MSEYFRDLYIRIRRSDSRTRKAVRECVNTFVLYADNRIKLDAIPQRLSDIYDQMPRDIACEVAEECDRMFHHATRGELGEKKTLEELSLTLGQKMSAEVWEGHIYAAAQRAAKSEKKGKHLPLGLDPEESEYVVHLITD